MVFQALEETHSSKQHVASIMWHILLTYNNKSIGEFFEWKIFINNVSSRRTFIFDILFVLIFFSIYFFIFIDTLFYYFILFFPIY